MARAAKPKRPPQAAPAAESRGRRTYTDAFKADAVKRAAGAQSIAQVARELGVARNTLMGWIQSAERVPAGLAAAAASGDRKAYLVALRDQVAQTIEKGIAARDLPPNARLLNDTMRELEEIAAREAEEAADAADAPDEQWDEEAL